MFYRSFLLFLLIFLASKASSTEYEIQAEMVEIDTEKNFIKYLEKVTFNSNEISFKANELIVNQNNEQIDASGSPIELSFRENGEKIKVVISNNKTIGIDVIQDYELVKKHYEKGKY